jgi:intraflagellar transport protein 122
MARHLLHSSLDPNTTLPKSILVALLLFALAKQSRSLGAYKLARYAYDRLLRNFQIPPGWRHVAENGWIAVRAKPFSDPETLAPICYQCSNINPLLRLPPSKTHATPMAGSSIHQILPDGNGEERREEVEELARYEPHRCFSCRAPFVRSIYTFENVPLVEFHIADGVPLEEALAILRREGDLTQPSDEATGRWTVSDTGNKQRLTLDGAIGGSQDDSGFSSGGASGPSDIPQKVPGIPVYGRAQLQKLGPSEVYIQHHGKRALLPRFFRKVLAEVPVTMCDHCFRFFHTDDYEFLVLQRSECPFCRHPVREEFLSR